jgi:hypothetical protein
MGMVVKIELLIGVKMEARKWHATCKERGQSSGIESWLADSNGKGKTETQKQCMTQPLQESKMSKRRNMAKVYRK